MKRKIRINAFEYQDKVDNQIKKFLKANGITVYGARSINAQTGIINRPTQDWDAYSKTPEKTSKNLQRELDKIVKGNFFYHKPAMHKGTWKVRNVGDDLIKGTPDDVDIADFSTPERKYPTVKVNGMRYRTLKEEIKAKKRAVADPEFKFRHEKDQADLDRIKANIKIKQLIS